MQSVRACCCQPPLSLKGLPGPLASAWQTPGDPVCSPAPELMPRPNASHFTGPAPRPHGPSPSALRPRRPRGPPRTSRSPPGTLAPGFPASPPPRMSWPCGLSAGHGGPGPGAGTLGRENKAATGSPRGHAPPPVSSGSNGAWSRCRRGPARPAQSSAPAGTLPSWRPWACPSWAAPPFWPGLSRALCPSPGLSSVLDGEL